MTFLVSGIWHGANWTFIAWGTMHGLLQIGEKALGWQKYEGNNWTVKGIRIIITFLIVNFTWIFFRMPDLSSAGSVIWKIITGFGTPDLSGLDVFSRLILLAGLIVLFFKDVKDEFFPTKFSFINKRVFRWSVYIVLFILIISLGVLDSGQFIYVSF